MTAELKRDELENLARELTWTAAARVPMLREFHEGKWLDRDHYQRWLIEVVLQIRMSNVADAYGLYKASFGDYRLAARLAKYLAEEIGHEGMFIKDLAKFGITQAEVDATRPFPATQKVMGYLHLAAESRGPAPVALWDWYSEWWTDQYAQGILDAVARELGTEFVRGHQAHVNLDENLDHDAMMFETTSQAVAQFGTVEEAYADLGIFVDLCTEKFGQLYEATIANR